jgi:hypothetical protein
LNFLITVVLFIIIIDIDSFIVGKHFEIEKGALNIGFRAGGLLVLKMALKFTEQKLLFLLRLRVVERLFSSALLLLIIAVIVFCDVYIIYFIWVVDCFFICSSEQFPYSFFLNFLFFHFVFDCSLLFPFYSNFIFYIPYPIY